MNKQAIFRSALNAIHYSGLDRLAGHSLQGKGAFLMLHHVTPGGGLQTGFAPNSGLEITPEFLDDVIQFIKNQGYMIVSIEESLEIMSGNRKADKPFVVFTLDDGYRDNIEHALPVFKKHDCPFTIFIAPDITDGKSELWWRAIEQVIIDQPQIKGQVAGKTFDLPTKTTQEMQDAFDYLYWPVRNTPEFEQRTWTREFCSGYGVDVEKQCAQQAMNWDEVKRIASDDLCTIGAHTIHHYAVARLDAETALAEMVQSADRIEKELGQRPDFFAYPYGDEGSAGPRDFELAKRAGFKMALTTRKGLIYDEHMDHLFALPRLSMNGSFQKIHHMQALLSGVPFALFNKMRKLNVA